MVRLERPAIYLCAMMSLVYLFSWIIQSTLFLNWDVSWILVAAQRLLAGGTYSKNFFETTPPMILYLSIPPVLFAKYFLINNALALRIYVFSIATMSILICNSLIKKIFSTNQITQSYLFIVMLTVVFLVLPVYEFGQREHLLVILTMPYLLLATCRLQNGLIKPFFAVLIGLLAALGFAIKPYYLLTPVLVELYVIFCKRHIFSCVRLETVTMGLVLSAYLVFALIFQQDYFSIVAPYVMRTYYSGMSMPWHNIVLWSPVLYCFLVVVFYIIQYKDNPNKILSTILLISTISFLLVCVIQRLNFYYHVYPAFSLAILLSVLLFSLRVMSPQVNRIANTAVMLFCVFVAAFLAYSVKDLWTALLFFPIEYYCYFAVLFAALLYSAGGRCGNHFKVIVAMLVILAISYLFSNIIMNTSWHSHRFILTTAMLGVLFILLVPAHNKGKSEYALLMICGALLFSFPFYFINKTYWGSVGSKETLAKLINFEKKQAAHQSLYFFSTTTVPIYLPAHYSGMYSTSRFSFLWMIPSLADHLPLSPQQISDKKFLIDMVSDDLETTKPYLVFVDVSTHKPYLNNVEFDYLNYFMPNNHFKTVWQSYRYLTTLDEPARYKFAVYQRIS